MGPSADDPSRPLDPSRDAIPVDKGLTAINSLASALEHLINLVLLIWLQQYLLQRIPVEEYAIYVVVVGPLLLAPLLVGALSSAVGRFVVVRKSQGDEAAVGRIVSTTAPLALGIAVVLALLTIPLWIWIEPALGVAPAFVEEARTMLVLLIGLTLFRIVSAPFVVGIFVQQRFVLEGWVSLGTQLLRMTLILGLLLLVEVRVQWVVVGTVAAEATGLLVTLLLSRRLLPSLRFRFRDITWSEAPALAAFGGWTFLKGAAVVSRRAGEPVVVNRMAGALEVSCFHLGSLVTTQLQFLMAKILQPMHPPLAALHARGETERLRAVFLRGNRLAFIAALFVSLPLVVYREELVALYVGERFLEAGTVMGLLVLQLPVRWSSIMAGMLGAATDQQRTPASAVSVINLLALVAIGVSLGLGTGAAGAAGAALLVTVLIVVTVIWPFGWRLVEVSGWSWARACLLPGLAPLAAGLLAWLGLREAIAPTTWSSLFLCFSGGAAAFLGTWLLTSATPEDRSDLRRVLGSVLGRAR